MCISENTCHHLQYLNVKAYETHNYPNMQEIGLGVKISLFLISIQTYKHFIKQFMCLSENTYHKIPQYKRPKISPTCKGICLVVNNLNS